VNEKATKNDKGIKNVQGKKNDNINNDMKVKDE